jgi:hypothetical protein
MTTAATAAFLQSEIWADLHAQFPNLATNIRVEVEPNGDDGQWRGHAFSTTGEQLPPDVNRTVISAQQRLRSQYFLERAD